MPQPSHAALLWRPAMLAAALVLLATGAAWAEPAPPRSADDFVDAMGVCTHWSYMDTPYGSAYEKVKALLGDLGVRHVRDGWHEREIDLYKTYGIRATTIFSPGPKPPRDQLAILREQVKVIDMIEGPNEVDLFKTTYNGKGFPEGPKAYQNDLYAAVKADAALAGVGVIAPSTARTGSNLELAPLASLDTVVMHSYAGGERPSVSLDGPVVSNILNAQRILGPGVVWKPIVVTECGYHTALGETGTAQPGVSERAQAKYIPRTFAEYFNHGIVRTFTYEFIDEFPDYKTDEREATNAEACFGLVKRDLTPKLAYTALKNLIALLKEASWDAAKQAWQTPPVTLRALDFTLEGDAKNVHHTLLQKSTGEYLLLLWQEVTSFDTKAKRDIANADVAVTLTLNSPVFDAAVYLPSRGPEPVKTFDAPKAIALSVPDEVLVVKLLVPAASPDAQPPAPPRELSGAADSSAVTLKWSAPAAGRAPVAGYFVWRMGRYLGMTAEPAFTDKRVIPGAGYTYVVQAFDRAGGISKEATVVVRTPLVFPDLVITDFGWDPAAPKAGDAVRFRA
ncbi:MAG: fibronectin type III domain-containing protein, partial [Planctomycetes bacterium]|nr:fibronectin type III domain-containing protein [Planctomycetota bacterium]